MTFAFNEFEIFECGWLGRCKCLKGSKLSVLWLAFLLVPGLWNAQLIR